MGCNRRQRLSLNSVSPPPVHPLKRSAKQKNANHMKGLVFKLVMIILTLSASSFGNGPQSVAKGGTEDWTDGEIKICPVHKIALEKVKYRISYGLIRRPADHPDMNREKNFPYFKEEALGGCVVSEDSPVFALVHRCSECCRLAIEWRAKHPRESAPVHERPIAPSNQQR